MTTTKHMTWWAIGLLGLAAAGLLFYITSRGIGREYDSVIYLEAAARLLRLGGLGQGRFARSLPHFPPLYPVILAVTGAVTGDLHTAARLLHALLWGANTTLAGAIVYRLTRGSPALSALAAALVLLSPSMAQTHQMALSEPLFIAMGLASLLLLATYPDQWQRRVLSVAGLLAGLALLTRYVGGALVVTTLLYLLVMRERGWRARLLDCLQYGSLASAPLLAWTAYSLAVGGRATDRQLLWHPVTRARLAEGLQTVASFVAPAEGELVLVGVFVVACALALLALMARIALRTRTVAAGNASPPREILLFGAYACFHVASVLTSISLFDALTPLSTRILAPVYVALVAFVLGTLGWLTRSARPALAAASLLPLLLLATGYLRYDLSAARDAHNNGLGYAHRRYQESDLVQRIRALPQDAPILTNNEMILYLMTDRTGKQMARKYRVTTLQPDPRYRERLRSQLATIQLQGGIVAYVAPNMGREHEPTLEEILTTKRFRVLSESEAGVLLQAR